MEQQEKNYVEIFEQKLEGKDYDSLKNMLEAMHPADIAETLKDIAPIDSLKVFLLISDPQISGLVLSHLGIMEAGVERDILEHLTEEKIATIISAIESDEAADILNIFPEKKRAAILSLAESEVQVEVEELLQYPEDTAGGLMDHEYLAVNQGKTIKETINIVRQEILPQEARIYSYINIFVVDDKGYLVGYLALRDLLIKHYKKTLKEVMIKEIISVQPEIDQEEVSRIFIKYDLVTLPVVDKENRMVGRITVDDVIDVIQEEATEDIYRMVGTDDEELWQKSVFKVAGIRLPWLLTTLMGTLCSALILMSFRLTLDKVLMLVFFIPAITAMGGNIGIQSSTIVVRGLATGHIELNEVWSVLFRELRVGLIMGVACGSIVGVVAYIVGNNPLLGLIVGSSMFFAILVAAMMGCLTPITFKKLNIDPAISSGPFVTTANDITGLLIYLGLATSLIKYLI